MCHIKNGVISLLLVLAVQRAHSDVETEDDPPMALRIAPPPMSFDNVSPKCWNFTHGNSQKMEFYSPGYPSQYTNHTDCVLYLEAPSNFKIQLDFRDTFKIESSENCKYDFLEVRDGPFAYSPLIKRFCGEVFPPLIVSNSRYLWLRFKSDDLIQDDGFKALYSYIKDNTQNDGTIFSQGVYDIKHDVRSVKVCTQKTNIHQANISNWLDCRHVVDNTYVETNDVIPPFEFSYLVGTSANAGQSHVCRQYLEISPSRPDGVLSSAHLKGETPTAQVPRPYDCTWEIHTDREYGIYVRTYNLTMRRPQRCDQNYVALYKRTTLDKTKYVQYCAGPTAEMKTTENRVFIRLYGKTPVFKPEMVLSYTVYRHDAKECTAREFRCDDMCLSNQLLCNGVSNCPNEEDETNCLGTSIPPSMSSLPLHTIVAGSIGGVIFTAIVIGICVSCHYRRRGLRSRKEDLKHQKLKHRNALELTVTNVLTASHSLYRPDGPESDRSPATKHQHLSSRGKDYQHRGSVGSSVQHSSDGDPVDTVLDIGNYKRFLSLEVTPDEESSPSPSLYSQTGVVTVERHQGQEGQYPRFTPHVWRAEDTVVYPYPSLKKNKSVFQDKSVFRDKTTENNCITNVPPLVRTGK